jgi:hypothetical protein
MSSQPSSPPSATADDRETRVRALPEPLRPHVERAARRMAEALVDCPDAQLSGEPEFAPRDRARDRAAAAHPTGLEGRKKGGARAAASPAPTAADPPSSSAPSAAPCRRSTARWG